ncbi:hypothetical protein ACOMHN_021838 [Nucella lapillus]
MRKSIVFTLVTVALAVVLFSPESAEGFGFDMSIRSLVHLAHRAYKVYKHHYGRRAVVAGPLTEDDMAKLLADLAAPCPQKAEAMTAELVSKFDDLDTNGDNTLDGAELDSFNKFLKTYDGCSTSG